MASSNWTTVALATGPAAVTGLLGYLAARLQSRATLRQAEVALEEKSGEYREEHLRNRQGTYHNLLDAVREADQMLVTGREGNIEDWWRRWEHLLNGASLFGTADVREAAERVNALLGSLGDVAPAGRVLAYPKLRPDFRDASRALIDAMRADVAPRDWVS